MDDDFESWTRSEISAAQAKIVEMERALALFLSWRAAHMPNGAANPRNQLARTDNGSAKRGPNESYSRQRASKNDAIFDAFEAAGPNGLSQEDLRRIASEAGLNTNPNALRALCWSAKQAGRLISIAPGRYAIAPKNEAAVENLSEGETAAPTRGPHNQHREGDAGGGI